MLSGTVEIDIEDWRENTDYKGGYYDGHVVVTWFWNTIYAMCNAERLKLLQVAFLYSLNQGHFVPDSETLVTDSGSFYPDSRVSISDSGTLYP